jgi:hypothetical protein
VSKTATDPPFALSLSKGASVGRPFMVRSFDKLTTHHERRVLAHHERQQQPFALSLSKGDRGWNPA